MIAHGDVWWVELAEPHGSEPAYRRPAVVVQSDAFNASHIDTVVVVVLTSNLRWAAAPGNVELPRATTGLPKDSVANVSQITTVDRAQLTGRAGRAAAGQLRTILTGIDVVLGRDALASEQ